MTRTKGHIHFIAIGGAAMHNLALALAAKGYLVTGSDDEIFNPSAARLKAKGLLPEQFGWFPDKLTAETEAVILGMHARIDNPELLKAQELGLKVYSYPEYIYQQSVNKQRIVIAGSHGKTTITAMIVHVLTYHKRKVDFLVGAQLEGFETMVKLTDDAPVIIIEGDEYFASPLERVPKFLKYKHHIALVSGIAWDHINVYPDFEVYVRQFDQLADTTPKAGTLVYNEDDDAASAVCNKDREDVTLLEYSRHPNEIVNGDTYLIGTNKQKVKVSFFGDHNMHNVAGAKAVLSKMAITEEMFFQAIGSFNGASNRLELLGQNDHTRIYKDFAHAPSKVEATIVALHQQFKDRKLIAVLELHTFSSLNKDFLKQYAGTMAEADVALVYYSPNVLAHKNLPSLSPTEVGASFETPVEVFTEVEVLYNHLCSQTYSNTNLLLMSSGNFNGLPLDDLIPKVLGQ